MSRQFFPSIRRAHLIVKEEAGDGGGCGFKRSCMRLPNEGLREDTAPDRASIRGSGQYDNQRAAGGDQWHRRERVFDFPINRSKLPTESAFRQRSTTTHKANRQIRENYGGSQSRDEPEFEVTARVKKREAQNESLFSISTDRKLRRW